MWPTFRNSLPDRVLLHIRQAPATPTLNYQTKYEPSYLNCNFQNGNWCSAKLLLGALTCKTFAWVLLFVDLHKPDKAILQLSKTVTDVADVQEFATR